MLRLAVLDRTPAHLLIGPAPINARNTRIQRNRNTRNKMKQIQEIQEMQEFARILVDASQELNSMVSKNSRPGRIRQASSTHLLLFTERGGWFSHPFQNIQYAALDTWDTPQQVKVLAFILSTVETNTFLLCLTYLSFC